MYGCSVQLFRASLMCSAPHHCAFLHGRDWHIIALTTLRAYYIASSLTPTCISLTSLNTCRSVSVLSFSLHLSICKWTCSKKNILCHSLLVSPHTLFFLPSSYACHIWTRSSILLVQPSVQWVCVGLYVLYTTW